jgi:hypothetical protein
MLLFSGMKDACKRRTRPFDQIKISCGFCRIDEEYVVNQLRQIASQLGLISYQWSVTTGLQRGYKEGPYYQTGDPEKMILTVLSLIKSDRSESGLFVLKDFDKYLENSLILRLFKDLVNLIKNTKKYDGHRGSRV